MTPNDADLVWWLKMIAYGAFAAFGGLMGHLMRTLDNDHAINWQRAVLEGVAAGFVGLLICLLCNALNLSEQWTGITVGLSGWLGANASIRFLESIVFKKLGITPPTPDHTGAENADNPK